MPTITLTPLAHGLGAISFGGVFKLSNGKIVLFDSGGTSVWEMADENTPAVLIHTAGFSLFKGAAIRQSINQLDRVLIAGDENVVFIQYDGGGSPTVSEHALTGFGGQTFRAICAGGGSHQFFVLGTQLVANALTPLDPTGISIVNATLITGIVNTLRELPGRPRPINAWGLVSGLAIYDCSDLAAWTSSGPWMGIFGTFAVSQGRQTTCMYRGKPATRTIAGAQSGWVRTDLGGEDQAGANGEAICAVFFTNVGGSPRYLAAESGDNDSIEVGVRHSTDGNTWNSATITTNIFDQDVDAARAFFASLVSNTFFMFNKTSNLNNAPNTAWWISSDSGQTWALKDANQNNRVMGFYSNGGAGPSEIIRLNTTDGTVEWSTDEGTSFNGPTAAMIPAADAALIRWIQETPTGLIAWGRNGPIYRQTAANLHTVAWENLEWPGGHLGDGHLRVTDAGVVVVHKKFDEGDAIIPTGQEPEHYETWEYSTLGVWSRKNLPQYAGSGQIGFEFLDANGRPGALGECILTGEVNVNGAEYGVVGTFTSHLAVQQGSWIADIKPTAVAISRGGRDMLVLADFGGRVKHVERNASNGHGFSVGADRQKGWLESENKVKNEFGTTESVFRMKADGDVIITMNFNGVVNASDGAKSWQHVLTNSDLNDIAEVVQ